MLQKRTENLFIAQEDKTGSGEKIEKSDSWFLS